MTSAAQEKPPKPTSGLPGLPPRPPEFHKGQAGRVLIIAGSRGMSGAAVLAAQGALRGGAGLVRVGCPKSTQPIVAASEPCLMTVSLREDSQGRLHRDALRQVDLQWPTVIAVGPGLGQSAALPDLLLRILASFAGPVVIDADGLNNLATLGERAWRPRKGRTTIITPHPGEMDRLRQALGLAELRGADDDTRLRVAHEVAERTGAVVVLKGHRTVVSAVDRAFINTTGNPGMATGGMGDVLTGLIAALLGQALDAFDATRLAVHTHGLAADYCAREIAPVGYLARDVAERIPAALQQATRPPLGFNMCSSAGEPA